MFSPGTSQPSSSLTTPFAITTLGPIGHSPAYDPSPSSSSRSGDLSGANHNNGTNVGGHGPGNGGSGSGAAILMRRLPRNTNYDVLRTMLLFAKNLVDVVFVANEYPEDGNFLTAVAIFETRHAAEEAQAMLHGKPNSTSEATMIVEMVADAPLSSALGARRNTIDQMPCRLAPRTQGTPSGLPSLAGSNGRPNNDLHAFEKSLDQTATNGAATTGNASNTSLPAPDTSSGLHTLFSAQSPIGNGFNDRLRVSGKSVIDQDVDEDTGELLKDPVAYARNGLSGSGALPRRATNPQSHSQMINLSVATNMPSPSVQQSFGSARNSATPASAVSPHVSALARGYNPPFHRPNYPPVNPADQNPPCNTLYVGNLPPDTSEDELKALFSKQRGYKRMIFRNKSNGPICFVEFEDVSFATKCLHELYGYQLSNSVKGGIRLSFSKNPLGVRNGQPGSMHPPAPISPHGVVNNVSNGASGAMGGPRFSTASGPPPGLAAPPGTVPSFRAHSYYY